MIPGEYELYLFGDRRPELYGALVDEMPLTVATLEERIPDGS